MKIQSVVHISLASIALLLLPQCDWFKTCCPGDTHKSNVNETTAVQSSSGAAKDVLVTMGDKKEPFITMSEFDDYVNDFLEAQPQYKEICQIMPAVKAQFLPNMVGEKVLEKWVVDNKIDQTPEYKKEAAKNEKYMRRKLAVDQFRKKFAIKVTDADARKFYEDNKNNIPELKISEGGVKAQLALFDKEDDAKKFFNTAKDTKVDFEKTAKDAKANVQTLDAVNDMSYDIDKPVRDKLLAMKKFPAVEMVSIENKKKFAVVKGLSKEEPKFIPYEQVKPQIEKCVEQEKVMKSFMQELEKVKSEYKIDEKPAQEFFEKEQKARMPKQPEAGAQEATKPHLPVPAPTEQKAAGAVKGA